MKCLLFAAVVLIAPVLARGETGNLLTNPGFEGNNARMAPGWGENTWPAEQRRHVQWTATREAAHGGATGQRIAIAEFAPRGGTLLLQNRAMAAGRVYEGSVWLRAQRPMRVKVYFRKGSFYYNVGAAVTVTAGPAWQQVRLRGGYAADMAAQVAIQPLEAGTLDVDDASLADITGQVVAEPLHTADAIGREFFGMHINKLGTHNTWPGVPFGTLRLWDTATYWAAVEPSRGAMEAEENWAMPRGAGCRLTYYVRHQQRNDPTCRIIYTMGVTPVWAAAKAEPTFYTGTANPPKDLEDWRRYVRTVGRRFGGPVRYWEIWNEADQGHQYHGDVKTMVEMTRIAHEELKAIRKENVILSPNITTQGVAFLDEFLAAGGGKWVDVISWHHYGSLRPENAIPAIAAVRDVMRRHGVADKPLWNTEGKPGGNPGVAGEDESTAGNDDIERAAVARAMLVQWAYGVRVFCWYMWDEGEKSGAIKLSKSSTTEGKSDYAALTEAGKAYATMATWLTGARMVKKTVDGERWVIEIEREGGYRGRFVWMREGSGEMAIPAEWKAKTVKRMDGSPPAAVAGKMAIGAVPVLVE